MVCGIRRVSTRLNRHISGESRYFIARKHCCKTYQAFVLAAIRLAVKAAKHHWGNVRTVLTGQQEYNE